MSGSGILQVWFRNCSGIIHHSKLYSKIAFRSTHSAGVGLRLGRGWLGPYPSAYSLVPVSSLLVIFCLVLGFSAVCLGQCRHPKTKQAKRMIIGLNRIFCTILCIRGNYSIPRSLRRLHYARPCLHHIWGSLAQAYRPIHPDASGDCLSNSSSD